MTTKLITAPTTEPLTLSEAKLHLRVTDSSDDNLISGLVSAARTACESQLNKVLMLQTWRTTYDSFPDAIELNMLPVASISSVKYIDTNGVEQTLSSISYTLDNSSDYKTAFVVPAYGYQWPAAREQINAVYVDYVCGYASSSAVPATYKQWMLLHIGAWYENRNGVSVGNTPVSFDYVNYLLNDKNYSL